MADIDDLHPTQAVVGFYEVKRKKNKIEDFKSDYERNEYFKKNTVPVVRGPNGNLYMIDHHHYTLAAYEAGYKEVYIRVVEDFSALTESQFWQRMKTKAWVYLKNNGEPITEYELPKHIDKLKDDPYRALAGQAREKGAFDKIDVPFTEFLWADYFRTRIPKELLEKDFKEAIKEAVRISRSAEAKHLPGYKTSGSCLQVYAD